MSVKTAVIRGYASLPCRAGACCGAHRNGLPQRKFVARRSTVLRALLAGTMLASVHGGAAFAQTPAAAGRVSVNGVDVPFSSLASPQARDFFMQMQAEKSTQNPGTDITQWRAFYAQQNEARVQRMRTLWPLKTYEAHYAGVLADVVEPAGGVAKENAHRVLINLHGGAFLWGARSGALVEAMPIAQQGKVKVVAVDYRQGPEYAFPAASDDVEKVYRELLKTYKAKDIGIYGCSAGGYLTGEVVARLIHDTLPLPGAVGTFCGSIVAPDGDSNYMAAALMGDTLPDGPRKLGDYPYFKGANLDDALVFAANSPEYVAKFPPTLLISGTRDFTLSSVLKSHQLLVDAGVDAQLHVWDGMWHAFFIEPELPESRQAYKVIWQFFDSHLGK